MTLIVIVSFIIFNCKEIILSSHLAVLVNIKSTLILETWVESLFISLWYTQNIVGVKVIQTR